MSGAHRHVQHAPDEVGVGVHVLVQRLARVAAQLDALTQRNPARLGVVQAVLGDQLRRHGLLIQLDGAGPPVASDRHAQEVSGLAEVVCVEGSRDGRLEGVHRSHAVRRDEHVVYVHDDDDQEGASLDVQLGVQPSVCARRRETQAFKLLAQPLVPRARRLLQAVQRTVQAAHFAGANLIFN